MKRFYKSIKSSNLNIAPRTCQNCRVIRIFLLSVLFILLLGVIKSDKLHYLQIITPMNAALTIITLGCLMFIIKLVKHLSEK